MSAEPIATPPGPWCPDPIRQQRGDRLGPDGERQYELVADGAELIADITP
ncbi:hypothetical protein ACFHW0_00500 [Micromonospora sp. LOL_025]